MDNHQEFKELTQKIHKGFVVAFMFIGMASLILVYVMIDPTFSAFQTNESKAYVAVTEEEDDRIENGIHVRTGLVDAEGLMTVVNNCTNCHSAKLVTQNRMNAERWAATIDWMQETQNLWDLGDNEAIIINYLVTNYPVLKKSRRQALTNIEWYELEE